MTDKPKPFPFRTGYLRWYDYKVGLFTYRIQEQNGSELFELHLFENDALRAFDKPVFVPIYKPDGRFYDSIEECLETAEKDSKTRKDARTLVRPAGQRHDYEGG